MEENRYKENPCAGFTVQGFQFPELGEWQMNVVGMNYVPRKKDTPNWFHRKMMTLFFGVKWIKHKS